MATSFYSGLEMQEVDASVRSLKTTELKEPAAAFVENVAHLHALLTLPLGLLNVGLWQADRMHYLSNAVSGLSKNKKGQLKRLSRQFDKGARHISAERARVAMVDIADDLLHGLLNNKDFGEVRFATRALFYASIASAWGAFESAAKDVWVAVVNSHPTLLAQRSLARAQEVGDDRIGNKQVSIGLLARHGYDLRSVMGDLLASKFDFTGIAGIRAAFEASFPGDVAITKALADPILGQLEATRHLIVHRAGLVDEEYKRRAGATEAVGSRLKLDGAKISQLTNAAVDAGSGLFLAVNEWLKTSSKKKARSNKALQGDGVVDPK